MAVTVSKWKEYSMWHQSRYIWHVCHQKFCRAARIAIYFSLLLTVFNLPILKDLVRVFFCIAVEDWGIILLVYCHFWLYLPTSVFAFLLVFTNTVCIPACICSPVGNWQAYRQDSWLDSEGKRFPLVAPWCLTTCSQTQESARNSWNIQMFLTHTFRHSWTYLPDKCLHILNFYPKILACVQHSKSLTEFKDCLCLEEFLSISPRFWFDMLSDILLLNRGMSWTFIEFFIWFSKFCPPGYWIFVKWHVLNICLDIFNLIICP